MSDSTPDLNHQTENQMKAAEHDFYQRRPVAYKNEAFLDSPSARPLRILSEYLEPLSHFRAENIYDTVVFFGSARVMEMGQMGRYYRDARTVARLVTEWSDKLQNSKRRFVVCTGGGPGIMEAANRGAQDAGGKTVGLNIGLPFEQRPNPFITPPDMAGIRCEHCLTGFFRCRPATISSQPTGTCNFSDTGISTTR